MYLKLSFVDYLKLSFKLKKFFWQTKDFKKHIYYYLATAVLSSLGTLFFISPLQNKGSAGTTNKPLKNDSLHKEVYVKKDSNSKVDSPPTFKKAKDSTKLH